MSKKRYLSWFEDSMQYDFSDKDHAVHDLVRQKFIETQSMFKYTGLPDTIPQKWLEYYIQTSGHCAICSVDGQLYAIKGAFGGEPDAYYIPTQYVVANPYLKFNKTLIINDDCVIMANDSLYQGLMPINRRYATLLMENNISMLIADINSRIVSLISASDDRSKVNADNYLKSIIDGKLGAISTNEFLEGIKTQPYATSGNNILTNLIEYHQYILSRWDNELALMSNYNMKRESLNSNEVQLNEDTLYPFIDDMLKTRKECIEKVNDMFGTDITVDLNSSWKDNRTELNAELDILENEVDNTENDNEPEDVSEPIEDSEEEEKEDEIE